MSRLTAKPCRACRQNPVITVNQHSRTISIKCPHCGFECETADSTTLFAFDKNTAMAEAIHKWNDEHGEF